MRKSIRVYTNDPEKKQINLQMTGMIKKFATIKPSKVFLRGIAGEPVTETVEIIPGDDEAFKILQVNALKGGDFDFSLKETEINGKPAYELAVRNIRETEGRYFDKIFMITNRSDQQPLSIIVSGHIRNPEGPTPEPGLTDDESGQEPAAENF
jgi:hypothetical protein